jgi:hypothetical protein
MGHFGRMLSFIKQANREFALWFGTILSWPIWLPLILLGSLFGWTFQKNDLVMLLLTIQTSVDSAATKMLQNHVRSKDEAHDKFIEQMLKDQAKRDKTSERQMKMLLTSVQATNDLLTLFMEGGVANVRRRPKTPRRGNRKRNQAKP